MKNVRDFLFIAIVTIPFTFATAPVHSMGFLCDSLGLGCETLGNENIFEIDGVYYKKGTNVPFTGEFIGQKNGKLTDKGRYKNGKRDGLWIDYRENGQIWGQMEFKNGEPHGVSIQFYPNGNTATKNRYKNGLAEGLSETFYENGRPELKGYYKNGQRDGSWDFFLEDGTKIEWLFKNGVQINN